MSDLSIKTTTVESLLGVLSVRPMSGYEIRQFMEHATGNFWSESFGQIYPALKRMLQDGLVTVEERTVEDHPAKKVYALTDAGRSRLRAWLDVPALPRPNRHELLLKVFFGDSAQPGAITAQVRAWRERYAADLERYQAIVLQLETQYAKSPGMPFRRMTVRFGITETKALIGWCDETLAELEKQERGG
jgi:PadR family transcriptional regulator AphA